MFFFLSLRQSPTNTIEIEPDILPTHSLSHQNTLLPKTYPDPSSTTFRTYITTWDFSDRPSLFRRLACLLAFTLHTPLNVISIISWGISLWMFVGIVISCLNLFCVGFAIWKLDIMRGERGFYSWRLNRKSFDYVILGLIVVYGGAFAILLFAQFNLRRWVFFFRVVWPCVIAADVFCFIAGWVATWRDIGFE